MAAVGDYIVIRTHGWGVMIDKDDVPNGIKSLIVLHNGAMPEDGTAVNLAKRECASVIPEDKRLLNHIAQIQLVGLGREA